MTLQTEILLLTTNSCTAVSHLISLDLFSYHCRDETLKAWFVNKIYCVYYIVLFIKKKRVKDATAQKLF